MSEDQTISVGTIIQYRLPVTPEPTIFVNRQTCDGCGEYGWCLFVLRTPSPDKEAAMMALCGPCLRGCGVTLNGRPLEPERTTGYSLEAVNTRRTRKER